MIRAGVRLLLCWLLTFAIVCGAATAVCHCQEKATSGERSQAADFLADLDELQRRLVDQSAALERLGFDYEAALDQLRKSIDDKCDLPVFILGLQKLIMPLGDCHAEVIPAKPLSFTAFLPFRPADTEAGLAALAISSDQPLDVECPYVREIDHRPLEEWLAAAGKFVARGSPQFVRRRSLDWLGLIELLREELHLPASETVEIGLQSADRSQQTTKRLRVTKQGYSVARVRLGPSTLAPGNIGYLRIPAMDERLIEATIETMKSFRETRGLVIDVRDNGGGTYGIMRGLYGFFVPDDARPKVTNIAAYRLSQSFPRDHLAYRPTFRAEWDGWNDDEREAIRQAMLHFQPEWKLPVAKFSDWHYMILSRQRNGRGGHSQQTPGGGRTDDYFHYDRPVAVLSNASSFSASDGFLNAMSDLPQVTIIGEPSAGGSGATRRFVLPRTRTTIALSSMASFRPSGKLFDGLGIEVDIAAKPKLSDFTNREDSVLNRAFELVQR